MSAAGPHATKATAPVVKLGYSSMSLRELVQLDRQKLRQARRTLGRYAPPPSLLRYTTRPVKVSRRYVRAPRR